MKNIKEITQEELDDLKVVVFDLDGVVIPVGTELKENQDGTELHIKSHQLSAGFINNLEKLKKHSEDDPGFLNYPDLFVSNTDWDNFVTKN